jgi:hypothetical protein
MCAHDRVGVARVVGRAHADGAIAESGERGRQGGGGNESTSEDGKEYVHGNNIMKDGKEAVEGHEEHHGRPANGHHHSPNHCRHHMQI